MIDLWLLMKDYTIVKYRGNQCGDGTWGERREIQEPMKLYHKIIKLKQKTNGFLLAFLCPIVVEAGQESKEGKGVSIHLPHMLLCSKKSHFNRPLALVSIMITVSLEVPSSGYSEAYCAL